MRPTVLLLRDWEYDKQVHTGFGNTRSPAIHMPLTSDGFSGFLIDRAEFCRIGPGKENA